MGTRGITEVIYGGKTVVAQYGQWDHYPSGQGITALNFLADPSNVEKLKTNLVKNVEYPTTEALDLIYDAYRNENNMMNMDQGDRFNKDYPSLTRDTGAGILEVIAESTGPIPLYLHDDFKEDKLFCEGIFIVNLDDETFTTIYNRYENENGEDSFTLTFDELRSISQDEYLEKSKCGVYQYQKLSA